MISFSNLIAIRVFFQKQKQKQKIERAYFKILGTKIYEGFVMRMNEPIIVLSKKKE